MLLLSVTLENFGAYKGKQSLELATRAGRPVILIGGLNGCGKTTLLDAIQLALYGARSRTSGRGARSYDDYLRDSVNRQANPKHARVAVEFSVTVEGQERRYKVVRSWEVKGKSVREFLNVLIDGDLDLVVSERWADYVEDLLPLEVSSLFFFDGEKIESLANPDRAASVIESAVQSLLGLGSVERLRTDLLAVQRRQKVSKEDQRSLDEIHNIEKQIRTTDELCDEIAQRVASKASELEAAERRLASIEEASAKEGGDLYLRRSELEAERSQVTSQLNSVNEVLAGTVAAGPLPLLLLAPQLSGIRDQVEKERRATEAAQVINVLSERDRELLALLKDVVPADSLAIAEKHLAADREQRASIVTEISHALNFPSESLPKLNSLDEILHQEASRARELVEEAQQHRERLSVLERQLAGVPEHEVIAALLRERDAQRDKVTRLRAELDGCKEELAITRRRRERLVLDREHAYKGRAAKLAKVEDAERIVAYADRVRATMEKFGATLLQRHISKLEVAVLKSFQHLMHKSTLVTDLHIDPEKFTITLVGPDDQQLDPSRLSAGERQLLAVSLLWGLAKVAGNRLPSVIDTPLGRLDSRHREHLVDRYFPHASHQVLLLSTDEEIDEYLLSKLKPSIAHTYTLVHDDQAFTTSIEPGYWWTGGTAHVA